MGAFLAILIFRAIKRKNYHYIPFAILSYIYGIVFQISIRPIVTSNGVLDFEVLDFEIPLLFIVFISALILAIKKNSKGKRVILPSILCFSAFVVRIIRWRVVQVYTERMIAQIEHGSIYAIHSELFRYYTWINYFIFFSVSASMFYCLWTLRKQKSDVPKMPDPSPINYKTLDNH